MRFKRDAMLCLVLASGLGVQIGCDQKNQKMNGEGGMRKLALTNVATCNYTRAEKCNANPNCAHGNPCKISADIDLNQNPPGVTVKVGAQPADIVCIDQNTAIEWDLPTANRDVLVDFGNMSPFSSGLPYATGTTTSPASDTTGGVNKCYKYNIKICPIATGGSGGAFTCGEYDPIVIVGDGG